MVSRRTSKCSKKKTVRKAKEQDVIAVAVAPNDVLLGRGSGIARHPGNQRFRHLILKYRPLYTTTDRSKKMEIAKAVVDEVMTCDPPGRFVEIIPGGNVLVAIGQKRALEKTAQALRERKWSMRDKKFHTKAKLTNNSSVTTAEVARRGASKVPKRAAKKLSTLDGVDTPPKIEIKKKTAMKRAKVVSQKRSKGRRALPLRKNSKQTTDKIAAMVLPLPAQVTPSSTPTNMEESGGEMLDGSQTFLPLLLQPQFDDADDDYSQDYEELLTLFRTQSGFQSLGTFNGDYPCLDEREDSFAISKAEKDDFIVPIAKEDDCFVPLNQEPLAYSMAAGLFHDTIPLEEETLHSDDVSLLPYDFSFHDENVNTEDDYETSNMVFQYCAHNSFI